MPRETISYGKRIVYVTHPATDTTGEWVEERDIKPYLIESSTESKEKTPTEGEIESRRPTLEVVWSRAEENAGITPYDEEPQGYVQIGMDLPRAEWEQNIKALHSDTDIVSRGVFSEGLTRVQINKLIRILKRARDAAFGVDE